MSRADPYPSNRFQVEVEGLLSAGFAEVDGLGVTAGVFADPDDVPAEPPADEAGRARHGGLFGVISDAVASAAEAVEDATAGTSWIDPDTWPAVVNWTEPGSSNPPPRQRRAEFPTLTLRRGVTDARDLESWIADWIAGASDERNVRVVLLDAEGRAARGWECKGAVPLHWSGPALRANSGGVAMESLELAHGGIAPIDLNDD